jgi:hypothetical protein
VRHAGPCLVTLASPSRVLAHQAAKTLALRPGGPLAQGAAVLAGASVAAELGFLFDNVGPALQSTHNEPGYQESIRGFG